MQWDRKAVKREAKTSLARNYIKTMLASLTITILAGGSVYTTTQRSVASYMTVLRELALQKALLGGKVVKAVSPILITLFLGAIIMSVVINIVTLVLFRNPIDIGVRRFMSTNMNPENDEPAKIASLAYAFDRSYLNTVIVMLVRDCLILLWSLLLVIPGIYKLYEYRMVPYLLTEDSSMKYKEALAVSKNMMRGHKKEALLLDLSYIPWHILGAVTMGLAELFFVKPYKKLADAGFYRDIKKIYIEEETNR